MNNSLSYLNGSKTKNVEEIDPNKKRGRCKGRVDILKEMGIDLTEILKND